jgi:hypothetical protein
MNLAMLHDPPPDQCSAPGPESAGPAIADVECDVIEVKVRSRGFYAAGFRHYYVDSTGRVFLIRGPGGATFQRVDDLPDDAEVDRNAPADDVLWHLGTVAELEVEGAPCSR